MNSVQPAINGKLFDSSKLPKRSIKGKVEKIEVETSWHCTFKYEVCSGVQVFFLNKNYMNLLDFVILTKNFLRIFKKIVSVQDGFFYLQWIYILQSLNSYVFRDITVVHSGYYMTTGAG